MTSLATAVLDGFGVVALVSGGVLTIFSSRSKVNESASTELISKLTELRKADKEEWQKRLDVLEEQHVDDVKALSGMAGQIDVLKSIPLVNIDTTLQNIAKFNKSIMEVNTKILDRLEVSATDLAKSNKKKAEAVREVKTDLEHT
jgi:hypothetical protein